MKILTPSMTEQPEWAAKHQKLVKWMSGWVDDLIDRHRNLPWKGGHDEALFARTLPAFYLATGYKPALEFAESLAEKLIGSLQGEACDCFLTYQGKADNKHRVYSDKWHGYYADWSCLCHGPENYAWFLAPLALASSDDRYKCALLDVAEHLGNWSEDVPDWFDWETMAFRSIHLGTRLVRDYSPYRFDSQTHFRLMTLALNAYSVSQDAKYLDLAEAWLLRWAEKILQTGSVPDALYSQPQEEYAEFYRDGVGPIQQEYCHLALDLCRYRPNDILLQSVRRQLQNPGVFEQWDTALVFAKYRRVSGDHSMDASLLDATEKDLESSDTVPGITILIDHNNITGFGDNFGYVKVKDGNNIHTDTRSVGRLVSAWQISGNYNYLNKALELAFMRFWASWYLWDGREFGCRGSWTGRNGVAMHNLIPALNMSMTGGFGMIQGEVPWADYVYQSADGWGLPVGVSALSTPSDESLQLFNITEQTQQIQFMKRNITSAALTDSGDWIAVSLPSKSLTSVTIG